jgi:glycine cleavage system transcriptional repressor
MPRFMVVALGADRTGVVAALSGVLVELGCNLSDTQMAVLQGYASMMLVVDAPTSVTTDELHSALARGTEGLGQALWVHPLAEPPLSAPSGRVWVVSVQGADRPGVVYEVTRLLAEDGLNIVDLQARLSGPVGSLAIQVVVPPDVDGNRVAARLDRLRDTLDLSCSMRPMP